MYYRKADFAAIVLKISLVYWEKFAIKINSLNYFTSSNNLIVLLDWIFICGSYLKIHLHWQKFKLFNYSHYKTF